MRIIDPYRETNQRVIRLLKRMTDAEVDESLMAAGILDEHGRVAAKYRTPEPVPPARRSASKPPSAAARNGRAPKTNAAKPRSKKAGARKRAAS